MVDKTLQIQHQIRANAEEVSSYLSEMSKWEASMKKKDKSSKPKRKVVSAPLREGSGTVPIRVTSKAPEICDYNKQEMLTPSIVIDQQCGNTALSVPNESVPKARGRYIEKDTEEVERSKGNSEFNAGNFPAAVKSYTKCLGLKSRNIVAFSNRAMAYIKMKEFHRAVADCNCALSIDPSHCKTLSRRATAFNALGKHRAAIRDLLLALEGQPDSRQLRADLQSSREMLRNAVNRAPMVPVSTVSGSIRDVAVMQGPDPLPASPPPPAATASRIAIVEEDDEEEEEVVVVEQNKVDNKVVGDQKPVHVEEEENARRQEGVGPSEPLAADLIPDPPNPASDSSSQKKKKSSRPSDPVGVVSSGLELQRLLCKALADKSGLELSRLFHPWEQGPVVPKPEPSQQKSKKKGASISMFNNPAESLKRVLGSCRDPELLFLFLKALLQHFSNTIISNVTSAEGCVLWVEWVSGGSGGSTGCECFQLLVSLWSESEREALKQQLLEVGQLTGAEEFALRLQPLLILMT